MAKFYGNIGFKSITEDEPGIWVEHINERPYYGDLLRNVTRNQSSDKVNDDVTINNQVSIVADPYANSNFQNMKYVVFQGTKWKIESVEVQYPRLLLSIGGLYHEQTQN